MIHNCALIMAHIKRRLYIRYTNTILFLRTLFLNIIGGSDGRQWYHNT